MKFINATKLRRQSGVWGTRPLWKRHVAGRFLSDRSDVASNLFVLHWSIGVVKGREMDPVA
jgi:hypothetical protein